MRDLEKLNVAKGRGNNERRGCSFFCYLLNLFKCFYRSWKMKKKNNPLCVLRDTCSNLPLPISKTSGEQYTLSERRKSMYLSFSCLSFHCNCDEHQKMKYWLFLYSGISIKRALYKVEISLRQTVYLRTGGFTVKLLWKNLCKADNYKADSRNTDTFSCPKWTSCLKIISIKRTQVQKQFSRKKTYFLWKITFYNVLLYGLYFE